MGDYAKGKKAASASAPVAGAPGMESFWEGVALGAPQSLIDPRVPGKPADAAALFPYIDHDHDADPVAMAAKVTAHLTASAAHAKDFTRSRAQRVVDELVAAMEHTDERDGHWKALNALDRLDDPALRTAVLALFREQTGQPLSAAITKSTWHGARDKEQAQALISPARASAERAIAVMSPAERAKLEAEAARTATEIASIVGRDSANEKDNAHKIHRALAGKTPEQIEAIRAAVRTQTRGHESLYEQLDRALSGGNEDEAVASLSGDAVLTASVALQNATGDAPRITDILRSLDSTQIASLKRRFPAATMVWLSVPPDQRAEIGALVNGGRNAADGAKVADLLRPEMHGVGIDGAELDEQSQHNLEARSPANIMRELEKMSPEKLVDARREWDRTAKSRGEKSWDAMIEDRFGAGDRLTYLRIRALVAGDKTEATALALAQGLRDHDQPTIDAALANPDLSSDKPEERAAAREHARAVAARVQELDAGKQQFLVAGAGGDVAHARGRNLDTQLADHYAHVHVTQRFDSTSNAVEEVLHPEVQAARRAKSVAAAQLGTDELREHGAVSTATEIHQARVDGDEARVARILEDQKDRAAVTAIAREYLAKYKEPLFALANTEAVEGVQQWHRLHGNDVDEVQASRSLRDANETRTENVRLEGPRAVRTAETQLRLDREQRDLQYSGALDGHDRLMQHAIGRAAGAETRSEWALESEQAAVHGPRAEFDQRANHTRAMSELQREEKIAMGDRAAQMLSIAGKLAALATLNPGAMLVIDAIVGLASIYVKGEIEGEAYKTATEDLEDLGVTIANDALMIPAMKLERALVRAAATLGISTGGIIVRNELAGRSEATEIDALKNGLLTIVLSPAGDRLEKMLGGGKVGKLANIVTQTSGGLAANGADGAVDVVSELAANANGIGSGAHPPAAHHDVLPSRVHHDDHPQIHHDDHEAPRSHDTSHEPHEGLSPDGPHGAHHQVRNQHERDPAEEHADQDSRVAAPSTSGRITEPVPGLFDSIDPAEVPVGWTLTQRRPVPHPSEPGLFRITTIVDGPNGGQGKIERSYDPVNKVLVLENAFLDELPRWINTGTDMVPGKGVPTVTYLTLRQMKELGGQFGDLKKVKMSTIQNIEAVMQLERQVRDGVSREDAVARTHSVLYATTSIEQSGHTIAGIAIDTTNSFEMKLSDMMDHYGMEPDRRQELFDRYQLGPDDEPMWNFDINIELTPHPKNP